MEITKEMTIFEIVKQKPAAADVLSSFGMHCLGCAMSRGETLEEAAVVHGIDINEMLQALNDVD